jgi:hypothetical protein
MVKFKKIIKIFFKIFGLKKKIIFSLEKLIPEISETEKNIIEACGKYSMTSKLRMYVLSQAIKYVKNENIEGDFVECGIWKGGNIILFNKFNLLYDLKKKIYGFDTFEGMSEPNELDKHNNIAAKELAKSYGIKKMSDWCYSSYNEVVKNISENTIIDNIFLIKGNVEQTLLEEKNLPEKISILRLDTDWYASTKIELEMLYKRLVKGGILIIDDYGHWQGARKAVDEYFKNKNIWLHYVDYTCRYIIKN